ncbi:MAG: hypothetical protein LC101_03610 [Flavobacteriales bacterium]|nr:hypothetical protein [Flavobacteriales bacterium]
MKERQIKYGLRKMTYKNRVFICTIIVISACSFNKRTSKRIDIKNIPKGYVIQEIPEIKVRMLRPIDYGFKQIFRADNTISQHYQIEKIVKDKESQLKCTLLIMAHISTKDRPILYQSFTQGLGYKKEHPDLVNDTFDDGLYQGQTVTFTHFDATVAEKVAVMIISVENKNTKSSYKLTFTIPVRLFEAEIGHWETMINSMELDDEV